MSQAVLATIMISYEVANTINSRSFHLRLMPKYGKRRGDRNGINVGGSVCAGIQEQAVRMYEKVDCLRRSARNDC